MPGSHGALVAGTADDARKTMLSAGMENSKGASGILAISPPDFRPVYESTKRMLTWPNGTKATLYSAEEPNRLRGPQHAWGWCDELAAWEKEAEAWEMFLFGLRLGENPQAAITTTPRPIKILRDLLKDPKTVVTRGTTFDNIDNLAPAFFASIISKHKGTRLGKQELYGEILDDAPGALWKSAQLDETRKDKKPDDLRRVVVAIDPAVSTNKKSDEIGMIVAGVGPCCCKGVEEMHGFVFVDESGQYSPNAWAQKAVACYHRYQADRIVAEINNGGNLVEANLRTVDNNIPYKAIHAASGKRTRAEPVAALYEQKKIHHIGVLAGLEDQMTTWDPLVSKDSPDRVDALVYALTDLILDTEESIADIWSRVNMDVFDQWA